VIYERLSITGKQESQSSVIDFWQRGALKNPHRFGSSRQNWFPGSSAAQKYEKGVGRKR